MKLILILILSLAFFLRLFWLESYPPGVTADEIGQGYSAYSILKTGSDEWGDYLPINPRGFGDYKPPLYTYLTIPSISLFGLNIFAVRLPSAILSSLTVLIIFLLVREIFNSKVGLIAAFFTAISFWNVHYSRLAWESNIGCFTYLLAVYLFLLSLKHRPVLILSALFFGISMFTYHSFKVLSLLTVLGLFILYREQLLKFEKKWFLGSIVIILLSFWFIAYGYLFSGAGRRAQDAAIYSKEHVLSLRNVQYEDKLPDPIRRIINNRPQFILSEFSQNYLGYFSTTFLTSPHRSNSTLFNLPGEWLISAWEFLLILVASFILIRQKILPKHFNVLMLILLVAPIPAALTKDYMHAQRAQTLLFLIPILSAFGAYSIFKMFRKRNIKYVYLAGLSLIIIWSFVYNMDHYLYHVFSRELGGMKYGYQETVEFVEKNKDGFDQVIFTKRNSEPQSFVAFYSAMEPKEFQKSAQDWLYFESEGFKFLDMINFKLGKYYFKDINFSADSKMENTLIVASGSEVPQGVKSIKDIYDPSGNIIFRIFNTNLLDNE